MSRSPNKAAEFLTAMQKAAVPPIRRHARE